MAEEGLPDLLRAPTGAGKTLAAVLPWLFRRRYHPDPAVRRATARQLVVVLPQRALVEQTHRVVAGWLANLNLAEAETEAERVGLHLLMGGVSADERRWLLNPAGDAIFVGTQDMVLSRLLLRGYAEPHARRPMSFGFLHSSTQFVFDEVQLMGPALPTSLQLAGLREAEALGTAAPCRSMWMSATVDVGSLRTVDHPGPRTVLEIGDEDRAGALQQRLAATRTVRQADVSTDPKRYAGEVARLVSARHTPGTRTIVVLNTVGRAVEVYEALSKLPPAALPSATLPPAAELVLLHSRFRPADRAVQTGRATQADRALGEPESGAAGTIVVTTQVLEAGVDVSSRLLVTELAPWSSMVQRAGRCNRGGEYGGEHGGEHPDAELLWVRPPSGRGNHLPYAEEDLDRSAAALAALEGVAVTGTRLQQEVVHQRPVVHPVLRRRDLLDLFDTAPDLSGNDLDISKWIRDADDMTVGVAWRAGAPVEDAGDSALPGRDELCQVPVGELRDLVGSAGRRSWVFDQAGNRWRTTDPADVRPGAVILLDAAQGGYLPERGWAPASREPVAPVVPEVREAPDGIGADPLTPVGRMVTVTEHLDDVGREVRHLLDEFGELPGLTEAQTSAAVLAGFYHDLGKAHPVFAASLRALSDTPLPLSDKPLPVSDTPLPEGPWAKSGRRGRLRHNPPYFRHELVSALMVLERSSGLSDGVAEPDLVAYLVAAHHGKVRMTVRSAPGEQGDLVLGVGPVEQTLPVVLPDGRTLPALTLHRDVLMLGGDGQVSTDGQAGTGGRGVGLSWQARACQLRDRPDLGPFRLAFLEAVVRVADSRASARYETEAGS